MLAYHGIGDEDGSRLFVSEGLFRQHVRHLYHRGYACYTFREAERRRRTGDLPERTVVFTFDDAIESVKRAAAILSEVGWVGTVFAVTDFADTERPLHWWGLDRELPGLSWQGLRALHDVGWEIGSHTCTHPLLASLRDSDLLHELRWSRARIGQEFGVCDTLAYPYGRADERVARYAEAVGYVSACTCTRAIWDDSEYLRPRLGLWDAHGLTRFRALTSSPMAVLRKSVVARSLHGLRPNRRWMPSA